MLPSAHVAFSWLMVSIAQETLDVTPDADYRLIAVAAMGPDLVDKPLAWIYFYRRYKSAVLFAHTLLANVSVLWMARHHLSSHGIYVFAFLGHALLDRIWFFPNTWYWPLRGWRFHVWGNRGAEQETIGLAYWITFTRRPELWGWELGGLLALTLFIWRHRLYQRHLLRDFIWTGKVTHF